MTGAARGPEHPGVRPRHLLLLLAGLVGVVTTTWRLGVASVRGDEVYYRAAALRYLEGDWLANAQHPPLVKELMALSMAVLGDGAVPSRLPAAVSAWLTGLVLAGIVWQLTGRTKGGVLAGVGGALLWWTLPFEPARSAMLEAPLCLFVAGATYAWLRARAGQSLRWFAVGGALVGLAVASKLTGLLAAAGSVPVIWHVVRRRRDPWAEDLLGPRARRRLEEARRFPLRRGLVALGTSGLAALTAWALTYVPFGADAVEAIRTSVTFQAEHARDGHPFPVAGRDQQFPPWWSGWWFQSQRLGLWSTVALWTLAVVGAVRHRHRAAPVTATLLALVAALALSPLQLPHYQYVWWPLLVALAAAAWAPAARADGGARSRRATVTTVVTALTLVLTLPLVVAAGRHVRSVVELEPTGHRAAAMIVTATVEPGTAITVWAEPGAMRAALPDQRMTRLMPRSANPEVFVVEPGWAERKGLDLALWEGCRTAGYERHERGPVVVYVREDAGPTDAPGELAPGCEALPFAHR